VILSAICLISNYFLLLGFTVVISDKMRGIFFFSLLLLLTCGFCIQESLSKENYSPYDLLQNLKIKRHKSTGDEKNNNTVTKKKDTDNIANDLQNNHASHKETIYKNEKLNVTVNQNITNTSISIPWKETVSSTVYLRGNFLYVIFNKKAVFNVDIINDFIDKKILDHPIVSNFSVIDLNNDLSCMIFKLEGDNIDNKFISVTKHNHAYNINLQNKQFTYESINIESKPFDASSPKVEFDIEKLKNTEIAEFIDPIAGDKIKILLHNGTQYKIKSNYYFIDFDILKSAYGIVIREKSDSLNIYKDNVIISIDSKYGLNISSKYSSSNSISFFQKKGFLKLPRFKNNNKSSHILDIEPYVMETNEFINYENILSKEIYKGSSSEEYNLRINLGMLYLANNYIPEALSHIKYAYKFNNPLLINRYDFRLLLAATLFMNNQFDAAHDISKNIDVSTVPSSNIKEVRFWQEIIQTSSNLENENNFQQGIKNYEFLSSYPKNILYKIKLLILKSLIHKKLYNEAEDLMKSLYENNLKNEEKAELLYENFVLAKEKNIKNTKNQLNILDMCTNVPNSIYYKSLCKLEKLKLKFTLKEINSTSALSKLYLLNLNVRHSELDILTLKESANIYIENKKYIDALLELNIIAQYYPNTIHSLNAIKEMSKIFIDIFLHDTGNYSSFYKVAIFDEFSNLNPIGSVGDKIALKLVENLIDLDLLERAAKILEHQIKFRLTHFLEDEAINKLLQIYLELGKLDKIIKFSEKNKLHHLSPSIKRNREYIYAKTFIKKGKYELAIKILDDDLSLQADEIRSGMYWKLKKWKEFNDNSEPYIYTLMQNNKILDDDDANKILMQSISYAYGNNNVLLEKLFISLKDRLYTNHRKTYDFINIILKLSNTKNLDSTTLLNIENSKKLINDIYRDIKSEK
jgi:hypothetical protein